MRLASLLALLALASAPRAQPDPTPPEDYYPLAVGNEWHYEDCVQDGPPCGIRHEYVRRTVERDTLVGGVRYVVEAERRYTTGRVPLGRSERLLRFDTATARLVRRDGAVDVPASCPLNSDFNISIDCSPYFGPATVRATSGTPNLKVYQIVSDTWDRYAAGVGLVSRQEWYSPFTLRYARVGGRVVFGAPVVITADEPGASPETALSLAASPNPTAGVLRLALNLPEAQTVTAEAFDALGRRVWTARLALGAGPKTIPVDARAWAPGVYVVRAVAGEARATVRVVRR